MADKVACRACEYPWMRQDFDTENGTIRNVCTWCIGQRKISPGWARHFLDRRAALHLEKTGEPYRG